MSIEPFLAGASSGELAVGLCVERAIRLWLPSSRKRWFLVSLHPVAS